LHPCQLHRLHNHRMPMKYQLYNPVRANQGLLQVLHGCLLFLRSFASRSAQAALACLRQAGPRGEGAGGAGGGILSAYYFGQ